jgi:hypothetical protein
MIKSQGIGSFKIFSYFLAFGLAGVAGSFASGAGSADAIAGEYSYLYRIAELFLFIALVCIPVITGLIWRESRLGLRFRFACAYLSFSFLLSGLSFENPVYNIIKAFLLNSGMLLVLASGMNFLGRESQGIKLFRLLPLSFLLFSLALGSGQGLLAIKVWQGINLFPVFFSLVSLILIIPWGEKEMPAPVSFPVPVNAFGRLKDSLGDKFVLLMISSFAVSIGSEFCILSVTPVFLQDAYGIDAYNLFIPGLGLALVSVIAGRLVAALLPGRMCPETLLLMFCILGLGGAAGLLASQKSIAVVSVILAGAGLGGVTPVLASLLISRRPDNAGALSGLLASCFPVALLFPDIMWSAAVAVSERMSFLIPAICLFYLTWAGILLVRDFKLFEK